MIVCGGLQISTLFRKNVIFNLVLFLIQCTQKLPYCTPAFDLCLCIILTKKISKLGLTLIVESVLANNMFLSFYSALIKDNHCNYMSK